MQSKQILQLLEDKNKDDARYRDITQSKLSEILNVDKSTIHRVLNGHKDGNSRRVRVFIALKAGMLPSMIWGGQLHRNVLVIDDLTYCDRLGAKNDCF